MKMRFTLRDSEILRKSINYGISTNSQRERRKLVKTASLQKKRFQKTVNNFTQDCVQNNDSYSPRINRNPKSGKRQSLYLDQFTSRVQSIIKSANINEQFKQTTHKNRYKTNDIMDQQLAIDQIQLGELSFQVPKCNQFIIDLELRALRSRTSKREKPNLLIVDQRRIQI